MCGIIGYSGDNPAVSLVVEGLRRLEYRGYDSAGVAFSSERVPGGGACAEGKLKELEAKLDGRESGQEPGRPAMAIGHTRWATHGLPVEKNAHPHTDNCHSLALVHNGIIENYREIREELRAKGHVFYSDTDTEAMAHLIAEGLKRNDGILKAMSSSPGPAGGLLRRGRGLPGRAGRGLRRAPSQPPCFGRGGERTLSGLGHPGFFGPYP